MGISALLIATALSLTMIVAGIRLVVMACDPIVIRLD